MSLRLLTLNVWALSPLISRDNAARMQAIGNALADLELDAAAFQETWHPESRAALVAAARGAGLNEVWHPRAGLSGGGLLVVSRWPIRQVHFERFALRGVAEAVTEADYLGGKGFAQLVLETPEGAITLFDTHLQAAYTEPARDPYVSLRVGQAVQLGARLREVETPVVLAGDLNFEDSSAEHQVLTGISGVRDVGAVLDRKQDTVLESNPYVRSPDKRIDYLFFRSGLRRSLQPVSITRVLDGVFATDEHTGPYSDHAGLLGEFALREGGAPRPRPDSESLRIARTALETGRHEVEARRRRQRGLGALGLVALGAALAAARLTPLSRRDLLAALLLGAGAAAGAFGASRLALTEWLRPEELRGFDAALALLDELAAPSDPESLR